MIKIRIEILRDYFKTGQTAHIIWEMRVNEIIFDITSQNTKLISTGLKDVALSLEINSKNGRWSFILIMMSWTATVHFAQKNFQKSKDYHILIINNRTYTRIINQVSRLFSYGHFYW